MAMQEITIERAMEICKEKNLKPGRVRGTKGVQFIREENDRLESISWEEFERTLKERKLAIYESGGWMKIMKIKRS